MVLLRVGLLATRPRYSWGGIVISTVVVSNHDGSKNHVSPHAHTQYLVLITMIPREKQIENGGANVVFRTHDRPKNLVSPHVYRVYLVPTTTVCSTVIDG